MQNVLARVRNPALRQGLTLGIILGIILIALNFIVSGLIIIAALVIGAALIAGMRASQGTGRIITGAIAGLWAGFFGTLILSIFSVGFILLNIDAVRKNSQAAADQQHLHVIYTNSQIITSYLVIYLIIMVLGVLLGVSGGAVGGSLGRRRAQLPPPEEYQEAMVEPPLETSLEEPSAETPAEEPTSTIPAEERTSATQPIEPSSTIPSEEPSSSTQSAE